MVGRDVGQVAVWDVRRRGDGPRRLFDDSTGVIAASLRLQVPQPPLPLPLQSTSRAKRQVRRKENKKIRGHRGVSWPQRVPPWLGGGRRWVATHALLHAHAA